MGQTWSLTKASKQASKQAGIIAGFVAATGVSGEINIVQIGETKMGHQNQHHRQSQSQSRGQSRHLDGTEKLAIVFSIQVVDDRAAQVVQNKVTSTKAGAITSQIVATGITVASAPSAVVEPEIHNNQNQKYNQN
jgi:hypothetical protein